MKKTKKSTSKKKISKQNSFISALAILLLLSIGVMLFVVINGKDEPLENGIQSYEVKPASNYQEPLHTFPEAVVKVANSPEERLLRVIKEECQEMLDEIYIDMKTFADISQEEKEQCSTWFEEFKTE